MLGRKPLPEEMQLEIKRLSKEGLSLNRISREVGVSSPTAAKYSGRRAERPLDYAMPLSTTAELILAEAVRESIVGGKVGDDAIPRYVYFVDMLNHLNAWYDQRMLIDKEVSWDMPMVADVLSVGVSARHTALAALEWLETFPEDHGLRQLYDLESMWSRYEFLFKAHTAGRFYW